MKSNRQRRTEIVQCRARKKLAADAARANEGEVRRLAGKTLVNTCKLRPTNSFGIPDFVTRKFYIDQPFKCKDCGKPEIWTATQQKWWYEVAQGDVWTTAIRCRSCRKKELARKAAARKTHLDGIAKKASRAE